MKQNEHIAIRPMQLNDSAKTLKWRNNPSLSRQVMSHPFPVTYEMEMNWYSNHLSDTTNNSIYFAICDPKTLVMVGMVYLTQINWISGVCSFHILIGESEARGHGFGKATLAWMIEYIFDTLHLRKINLEVIADNSVAIKLYTKFGFLEEGLLVQQYYNNGKYYDVMIMSLINAN